jgi:hypothetical protein
MTDQLGLKAIREMQLMGENRKRKCPKFLLFGAF